MSKRALLSLFSLYSTTPLPLFGYTPTSLFSYPCYFFALFKCILSFSNFFSFPLFRVFSPAQFNISVFFAPLSNCPTHIHFHTYLHIHTDTHILCCSLSLSISPNSNSYYLEYYNKLFQQYQTREKKKENISIFYFISFS